MQKKEIPINVQDTLTKLQIHDPVLLGKGGEGYIFSYKNDMAVKVYTSATLEYLQSVMKLQKRIATTNLPFSTPLIEDIGELNGTYYTLEKRLTGVTAEQKFPTLPPQEKYTLLKSYYNALKSLNAIELPDLPYGNIVKAEDAITDTTWQGFLLKKLHQRLTLGGKRLQKDVVDYDKKVQWLEKLINGEIHIDRKHLVHSDYYVNQVLVNDHGEVSAVLDISVHALAGDRRLDVASVCFFEDDQYLPEHMQYLVNLAKKDYGEDIVWSEPNLPHQWQSQYLISWAYAISNSIGGR